MVLVDVEQDRPVIEISGIEKKISNKTKAIIPVHLNGRDSNMEEILKIGEEKQLYVIEDAAQALYSKNKLGYLGCQSFCGCFSMSLAKIISTGQGGFAVTNNPELALRMRNLRTHGVESVKDPNRWNMPGFNFRFTDLQASIGIEQLPRLPDRVRHQQELYQIYAEGMKDSPFTLISVDLENGEVPVYNEFLVENRTEWIDYLADHSIDTRPFYPDLDTADYISQSHSHFPNSRKYGQQGIYLPSGSAQDFKNAETVIEKCKKSQS